MKTNSCRISVVAVMVAVLMVVSGPAWAARASFAPSQNFSVGDGPRRITSADFNGDGKPDLAAASFISNNVSVLPGDGFGGFGEPTSFTAGEGPTAITNADFSGDGKPDLATANDSSDNVSVLLNTTGENGPPVVNDDSYTVKEDKTLTVRPGGILANDTDGDPLTTRAWTGTRHGKLKLNLDGSFTYTPKTNFNGADSFTYRACDEEVCSAPVKG